MDLWTKCYNGKRKLISSARQTLLEAAGTSQTTRLQLLQQPTQPKDDFKYRYATCIAGKSKRANKSMLVQASCPPQSTHASATRPWRVSSKYHKLRENSGEQIFWSAFSVIPHPYLLDGRARILQEVQTGPTATVQAEHRLCGEAQIFGGANERQRCRQDGPQAGKMRDRAHCPAVDGTEIGRASKFV